MSITLSAERELLAGTLSRRRLLQLGGIGIVNLSIPGVVAARDLGAGCLRNQRPARTLECRATRLPSQRARVLVRVISAPRAPTGCGSAAASPP